MWALLALDARLAFIVKLSQAKSECHELVTVAECQAPTIVRNTAQEMRWDDGKWERSRVTAFPMGQVRAAMLGLCLFSTGYIQYILTC